MSNLILEGEMRIAICDPEKDLHPALEEAVRLGATEAGSESNLSIKTFPWTDELLHVMGRPTDKKFNIAVANCPPQCDGGYHIPFSKEDRGLRVVDAIFLKEPLSPVVFLQTCQGVSPETVLLLTFDTCWLENRIDEGYSRTSLYQAFAEYGNVGAVLERDFSQEGLKALSEAVKLAILDRRKAQSIPQYPSPALNPVGAWI